ncbi:hypothetical protein B0H16DRAFT_1731555 [Mycena metata]|uniref:Uncharacterized protein n=1 Tax=Mycena metata TaxID=1033252 RepID=A0AAD7I4P5_9AGAR|nr:hypothetical protein B0H16DRAFT_1731555 [Mycena metata]
MNFNHILAFLLSVTAGLIAARNTTTLSAPHNIGRSTETCGNPVDALSYNRLLAGTGEYLYLADVAMTQSTICAGWDLQTVTALVFPPRKSLVSLDRHSINLRSYLAL